MPASERDAAQAAMIDGALREAALLDRATAAEALAGELAERLESLLSLQGVTGATGPTGLCPVCTAKKASAK